VRFNASRFYICGIDLDGHGLHYEIRAENKPKTLFLLN
jgi:hypothetical protein